MQFVDFKAEAKEYESSYQEAFSRTLHSGWYILGKEVEEFENKFAKYLGAKHVVGVANGLEAIQISLMVLGIGEGDEVITTPLSAVATTLAVMAVGATPVFVDIKEDGQLDENLVEQAITARTKAILPVHLYGNACNIQELNKISTDHDLYLIEDAAQAQGSSYQSKMLGTIGDLGCFSFYPTKNLGAIGDAGAITTNDEALATACKQIRDYGQESKYKHSRLGLNSRLDELQAAFLGEKLKTLDTMNDRRRNNAAIYTKLLDTTKLEIITPVPNSIPNYHQFVIKVKRRDDLQQHLKDLEIPTLIHYPILIPDQPLFKGKYDSLPIPIAHRLVNEILSLPCGPYMTKEQIEEVSNAINKYLVS